MSGNDEINTLEVGHKSNGQKGGIFIEIEMDTNFIFQLHLTKFVSYSLFMVANIFFLWGVAFLLAWDNFIPIFWTSHKIFYKSLYLLTSNAREDSLAHYVFPMITFPETSSCNYDDAYNVFIVLLIITLFFIADYCFLKFRNHLDEHDKSLKAKEAQFWNPPTTKNQVSDIATQTTQ